MATIQTGNTVEGSISGRDLTVINNYASSQSKPYITLLYERFRLESNPGILGSDQFVEELQHYIDKPASALSRTLAEKLSASSRADLIQQAEEMKERAMKRIMKFQSSQTAQEIFAYVLSELHAKFILHIKPLLAAGVSRTEVDAAMEQKVVNPVAAAMEPSPLALNPGLVLSLVFYLAGNCHINWD